MSRLIDSIQMELSNKNLIGEVRYIVLSTSGYEELLDDFLEEFRLEYMEMGRNPNEHDLKDYFKIPILINGAIEEKYSLLKEI